jgi:hypothetical protein
VVIKKQMAIWYPKLVKARGLILMSIMITLSGCALPFFGGYGEQGMSREEFTRYVEGVFRLQNSITSEVMMQFEGDNTKKHNALLQAEQHMQEACGPLNEYVSRESDGLSIGLFLRRRVEKSAIDCEREARKVKALLAEQSH